MRGAGSHRSWYVSVSSRSLKVLFPLLPSYIIIHIVTRNMNRGKYIHTRKCFNINLFVSCRINSSTASQLTQLIYAKLIYDLHGVIDIIIIFFFSFDTTFVFVEKTILREMLKWYVIYDICRERKKFDIRYCRIFSAILKYFKILSERKTVWYSILYSHFQDKAWGKTAPRSRPLKIFIGNTRRNKHKYSQTVNIANHKPKRLWDTSLGRFARASLIIKSTIRLRREFTKFK